MNVLVHVPYKWFGITVLVIMHVIDDLLCGAHGLNLIGFTHIPQGYFTGNIIQFSQYKWVIINVNPLTSTF